jgi:MFS transporter, ACS family, tartrate transporter
LAYRAAEGTVPIVYFYVTYWFPKRERARAISLFNMASAVASLLGAPVSGLILDHVHWMGVSSWRWLLVLEALPAIVLGLVTYLVLPSSPREAKFLSPDEKKAIEAEFGRDEEQNLQVREYFVLRAMASPRVWHLISAYVGITFGGYTPTLWGPQVVKSLSNTYSNGVVRFLTAIPSLLGLVAMILVARSSDRMMERRYRVAVCAMVGATALLLLSAAHSPFYSVALLSILAMGS